ncbi:MAG: hypothetical protein U0Z17_03075 [Bacteroidales bacterium]
MKHNHLYWPAAALALSLFACTPSTKKQVKIMQQSDFPAPPVAAVKPSEFTEFGNKRIDNYYWLRDKSNPEVINYLKAENAYCNTVMQSTKALQDKLFNEMKSRIKEDDETVPELDNGYYYYTRTKTGKQYRLNCRKKGSVSAPEEIVFDVNKMAEGKKAFLFSSFQVSTDNKLAAYLSNQTGSYADFTLRIRDLATGTDLPFNVDESTVDGLGQRQQNPVFIPLAITRFGRGGFTDM